MSNRTFLVPLPHGAPRSYESLDTLAERADTPAPGC